MNTHQPNATGEPRVSALYYYPIKSCGGTRVDILTVDEGGPRHDRELMIVAATTGVFLTQRQLPRMALIIPSLSEGRLRATAPDMPSLEEPVVVDGTRHNTIIWNKQVESVDQGERVAAWFSRFLDHAVRVVRKAPGFIRRADPAFTAIPTNQVAFADEYPVLLLSQESLTDLNGRLAQPAPMDRFRPNIVLTGCPAPHYEDTLRRFRLGPVEFSGITPCVRCAVVTVNQETAQVGKEPLQTLATYRRSATGGVTFGMNLIHHTTGDLSVGDQVVSLPSPLW